MAQVRPRQKSRRVLSDVALKVRLMFWLGARIFWWGDTTAIRVLMAVASLVISAVFLAHPETFDRRAWTEMAYLVNQWEVGRAIGGPVPVWAALFAAHGFGVFWRLREKRSRVYWALAINWLGLVLWVTEFTYTNLAIGEMAAGNALELPAIAALFVALCRTGLNDEKFTP